MILEVISEFTKESTLYVIDSIKGDATKLTVIGKKITEDKVKELTEKTNNIIDTIIEEKEENITIQPIRKKIERRVNPKKPNVTVNPNDELGLRQLDANLKTETVTKVLETPPVDLNNINVIEQPIKKSMSDTDKLINVLRQNGIVKRERRERDE